MNKKIRNNGIACRVKNNNEESHTKRERERKKEKRNRKVCLVLLIGCQEQKENEIIHDYAQYLTSLSVFLRARFNTIFDAIIFICGA